MPVAWNCCVVPSGIEADCGVTAMETKTIEFTVRLAVPAMLPLVTLITVFPTPAAVACPCEPGESLMVAILGTSELQ